MNRLCFFPVVFFLTLGNPCNGFAAPAVESDPVHHRLDTTPRHHEWVDVDAAEGRQVHCFVAYPEVSDKATAVIVIHENKGLTDWVRSVADQVAEAGYVAIAPDMLTGAGPAGGNTDAFPSVDAATQGIYKLPDRQVADDLDGVYRYISKLDAANGKVAVIGFCWGGGQTFAYAARNAEIVLACPFYGPAPEDKLLQNVKAPVHAFYGGNDRRISGQVPATTEKMKAAGKTYVPTIFEGAGHGFMRSGEDGTGGDADKKAREEAWAELKKLLSQP